MSTSSVRLLILDLFERHGEMHGYELRALAKKEHVQLWEDLSSASFYQVLKRLVADGMLAEVRSEQKDNKPKRHILSITKLGVQMLDALKINSLEKILVSFDPFDLALSIINDDYDIDDVIVKRIEFFKNRLHNLSELKNDSRSNIKGLALLALDHRENYIVNEIEWHEEILDILKNK